MFKILSLLTLAVVLSFSAAGQNSKFQPLFTAITVANIDSSINWYTGVLNLKLRNRVDNE